MELVWFSWYATFNTLANSFILLINLFNLIHLNLFTQQTLLSKATYKWESIKHFVKESVQDGVRKSFESKGFMMQINKLKHITWKSWKLNYHQCNTKNLYSQLPDSILNIFLHSSLNIHTFTIIWSKSHTPNRSCYPTTLCTSQFLQRIKETKVEPRKKTWLKWRNRERESKREKERGMRTRRQTAGWPHHGGLRWAGLLIVSL